MYPVNRCKFLDFVLGVEKNAVRGVYGGERGGGGGQMTGCGTPQRPHCTMCMVCTVVRRARHPARCPDNGNSPAVWAFCFPREKVVG